MKPNLKEQEKMKQTLVTSRRPFVLGLCILAICISVVISFTNLCSGDMLVNEYTKNLSLLSTAFAGLIQVLEFKKGSAVQSRPLVYPPSPPPPSSTNQTSAQTQSDSQYDSYDEKTWTLRTTKYRDNGFAIQPYAANGYIGIRIPVQGQGFSIDLNSTSGEYIANGWPLYNERYAGAFVAGFWDNQPNTAGSNFPELLVNGSESVISSLPVWSTLIVTDKLTDSSFNISTGNDEVVAYDQSMSLKNGIIHTNVTWKPAEGSSYQLNYTILAHRSRPSLGIVRLDITSSYDSGINLSDILDGAGSMRTTYVDSDIDLNNSIWTAVTPNGITDTTAFEYSTLSFSNEDCVDMLSRCPSTLAGKKASTVSQQFTLSLKAQQPISVFKYVGIASTDAFPTDSFIIARQSSRSSVKLGWDSLIQEHNSAWQNIWDEADIVVPGDQELQVTVRATIFHLLANARQGSEGSGLGDNSMAVSGLSSDSYGGLIFWDADLWMNLGLQAMYPDFAMSINNYRNKLRQQALTNADLYNYQGALYPWTSSRYGNCTANGPCVNYQYHLNTDVAFAHWNYFLSTNDTKWLEETGYPIIYDAVDFFANFVQKNGTDYYHTFNLTDPDEYANHIDDGAFTNAGISQLMKWGTRAAQILGKTPDPKWLDVAQHMYIPEVSDLDLTVEFQGMNGTAAIKQADVVLITYPLDYPQSVSRGSQNLNYYASRQSPDGPAMTYAIFAIDVAQLASQGCSSYTYLLYASQPYVRSPYYQFSEQLLDNSNINGGTRAAFPFLTGHGGFLQVYTHGMTGFRTQEDAFYLDPTLPPQMPEGYMVKGMKYQGAVFDVNITLTNTIIIRKEDRIYSNNNLVPTEVKIRIGSRNAKAGDYTLKVGESLTVPTYRADLNGTMLAGNLAECKPIGSSNDWIPGAFPVAMTDGDNSTFWQPLSSESASVIIDLGEDSNFTGAYFLWGSHPPKMVSIGIAVNYSSSLTKPNTDVDWIVESRSVELSAPYDPSVNPVDIRIVPGNETTIDFGRNFQARYVQIEIEGNYDGSSKGGRIAEFSLY